MEIIKIELPRTLEPHFYCPFSGYDLLDETMYDAIEEGHLILVVGWADPDFMVMGNGELVRKYRDFRSEEDEDPTARVTRFLKYLGSGHNYFIIELTVNAMANGPITEINTMVFSK